MLTSLHFPWLLLRARLHWSNCSEHPRLGEDTGASPHLSAVNEQGQKEKLCPLPGEMVVVKTHTFTPTTFSHG